jgi:hypothetical protein
VHRRNILRHAPRKRRLGLAITLISVVVTFRRGFSRDPLRMIAASRDLSKCEAVKVGVIFSERESYSRNHDLS